MGSRSKVILSDARYAFEKVHSENNLLAERELPGIYSITYSVQNPFKYCKSIQSGMFNKIVNVLIFVSYIMGLCILSKSTSVEVHSGPPLDG